MCKKILVVVLAVSMMLSTMGDFSSITEQIDELEEEGQYWISTHGDPSGLQHVSMWVGDEKFLMDLVLEPELAMEMIKKHNKYRLEHALKTLEAGGGRIHEEIMGLKMDYLSLRICSGSFSNHYMSTFTKRLRKILMLKFFSIHAEQFQI